jgi:hypothetical protein
MINPGRILAAGTALVWLATAACGKAGNDSAGEAGTAGGGGPSGDAGFFIDAGEASTVERPCPGLAVTYGHCPFESWELDDVGGAGAAGAAGATGAASGADCVFALSGVADPTRAFVALDCELLPYADSPTADGPAWGYDIPDAPTAIVLNEAACELVERGEAEQLDAFYYCPLGGS